MKLSAVVITYNESRNIARCLKSLSFCDETIVVDSESTDETVALAKAFTPHVFISPWKGYVAQKNYANSLAKGEWILSVDADEEVSAELAEKILDCVRQESETAAYAIPRKTIHSGKWIRHGGWYPNRLIRLFRKSKGRWAGGELHEYVEVHGQVLDLDEPLIHHSFTSLSDQVVRNDRYSTLGAQQLKLNGARFSPLKLVVKPFTKFCETYVLKCGFLDGYPGFMISTSAAYSVFLKWAKLWEMQKSET